MKLTKARTLVFHTAARLCHELVLVKQMQKQKPPCNKAVAQNTRSAPLRVTSRRHARLVLLLALAGMVTAPVAQASPVLLTTAPVNAAIPWNSVGVSTIAGQQLILTATGIVTVAATVTVTAAGTAGSAGAGSVLVGAPQYGLVCKVGDGAPIHVGSGGDITATGSGELLCGVNEISTATAAYADNVGSWTLAVSTATTFDTGAFATLAGGSNITDPLFADTVLEIRAGSQLLASGAYLNPVTVASSGGSQIRVTATDTVGTCRASSPLWIHYASGLGVRLNSGSLAVCGGTAPATGVFFDQTYPLLEGNAGWTAGVVALNLQPGWNLLGNGYAGVTLGMSTYFADTTKFNTVWKWVKEAGGGRWAFYNPGLDAQALANYASSQGFAVLTSIEPGEGFWVNVKGATPIAFNLPTGAPMSPGSFGSLSSGWSLLAIGGNVSPQEFNNAVGFSVPPGAGTTAASNLTSLWAWEPSLGKWLFYAPTLDAAGGSTLATYAAGQGFLDFASRNQLLVPGRGFWVNR